MMKSYKAFKGFFDDGVVWICEDGKPVSELPLCLEIRNHSPTGFAWGYGGSGPTQLSLSILVDAIGQHRALKLYQYYKGAVISRLDQDKGWSMSLGEVLEQVETIERMAA
jgi:hypothetical protein